MKKAVKLLFVLSLFSLFATSCKKDKDDQSSIVGKWGLFEETVKTYLNGNLSNSSTEPVNSTNKELYYTLEFKADGKYVIEYIDEAPESGSYRIEGAKAYIKGDGQTSKKALDWSVNNNELTITIIDESAGQGSNFRKEYISKYKKK
ncbi:lipocalin family protein [Flavisolibacter tropicus]|uniref:Lipocalin-like domain-containing protein n=1 Tax=Flavisolibacter tropicus TaxID=1492898 RepID=A0A172U0T1_9BACT|nr:lipocalin family protein [Flavisolibacter tropicus]ANE52832.1 hypothetical protein SY85_22495 [Flavisolibacter tropicus]